MSVKDKAVLFFFSGVMVTIYAVIVETQQNSPNEFGCLLLLLLLLRETSRDIIHGLFHLHCFVILLYLHV